MICTVYSNSAGDSELSRLNSDAKNWIGKNEINVNYKITILYKNNI